MVHEFKHAKSELARSKQIPPASRTMSDHLDRSDFYSATGDSSVRVNRDRENLTNWSMTIKAKTGTGTEVMITLAEAPTASFAEWVGLAEAKSDLCLSSGSHTTRIRVCGDVYKFTIDDVATVSIPIDGLRCNLIAIMQLLAGQKLRFRE